MLHQEANEDLTPFSAPLMMAILFDIMPPLMVSKLRGEVGGILYFIFKGYSMTKKDKIRARIMQTPPRNDIEWVELKTFLLGSSATLSKIKTGGSRRKFVYKNEILRLHKPHPQKTIKKVYLKGIQ